MRLEHSIAIVLMSVSLVAHGAESTAKKVPPASKPAPPDIKFLEYLGMLEGDDENWTEIANSSTAPPTTPPNKRAGDVNDKTGVAAKRATESKQ